MSVWQLPADRANEAVELLLEIFPDFPGSSALDPAEERRIARVLHERTLASGLANGRVDVWGDPPVGVAVWIRRPALGERVPPARPGPGIRDQLPAQVVESLALFNTTVQRLRGISRPDQHVYLDMIGVLPAHRRRGIATALLEAGHAWADELGLPTALDTDDPVNVAFYERRGYVVMGRDRNPELDWEVIAMRRDRSSAASG